MQLENVVIDAVDPGRLGRFWEELLASERLTDEPDGFETRLAVDGGPTLDLCFQRVPVVPTDPPRLHLDLLGGPRQTEVVDRAHDLGARALDLGRGDAAWVSLADPEGNPFRVVEERAAYVDTGPLAALPLDSADPARDLAFWAWLTGWVAGAGAEPHTLRHPSRRGVLLELRPEPAPKGPTAKNRTHLDLRLEPGEHPDRVAAEIATRGGLEVSRPEWGDLPWRLYQDPSGNEFCVLPAAG